ncbi:tyrosine phosphatase family protein [Marinivivus vitaminiproducens]|uniref:tyrosine phosphatase family protein n=1 Tax=Marinivivus vitaminiproducens TaxID=3035935 RepID=UPI0027A60BD9|nr:hypothetical protein P4R82_07890 [Geminicoccaceae bacterium SCSIO 64248]
MSVLYISDLAGLEANVAAVQPGKVITLLAPGGTPPPELPGLTAENRLCLFFHDVTEPTDPAWVLPAAHHVEAILGFGRDIPASGLLVHCFAGFSRSTAAALALLALHNPGGEDEAARRLRAASAHAVPNPLLIALADAALACDGRLRRALQAMPPATSQAYGGLMRLDLALR